MASHKYIQKLFTVIEFVIIFLVIAFLLASTIPGLLRVRKLSQTSKIVALARSGNRLATAQGGRTLFGNWFTAMFTFVTL